MSYERIQRRPGLRARADWRRVITAADSRGTRAHQAGTGVASAGASYPDTTQEAQAPRTHPVNYIKGKMYLPDGMDASDIIWFRPEELDTKATHKSESVSGARK